MPLGLQAKLLRALQERKVTPLGSQREVDVNVRVIATTNRQMLAEVREGRFREDLFYRLNVFPLATSNLNERKNDIVAISTILLGRHAVDEDSVPCLAPDAVALLLSYGWMGFTTKDNDNDNCSPLHCSENCAVSYTGAWWYKNCHLINPNGHYLAGEHTSYADGINWKQAKGFYYSMKTSILKVRRNN